MEISILLTRKFFDDDINYLKRGLSSDCKLIIPKSFEDFELFGLAKDADIFLGNYISKALCKAAPKLKFIQIPWTGVDNLHFQEIDEIAIPVCNSHSNAYAVAEHAVALMFDTAKKIAYHDSELRKGFWNRPKPDKSNEISPFSKRISKSIIGIIGYGHIGKTIHKFLSGFDCNFFISDQNVIGNTTSELVSFILPDEINSILPKVDIIFICVPLTDKTKNLVDKNFLLHMKRSALLINISRGEVINEDDLFYALKNSEIAGAGIDTWYNYPKNPNEVALPSLKNSFNTLKNIVLSPHRSAFIEGELPHLDDVIVNLNRASEGLEPINIVSTKNRF